MKKATLSLLASGFLIASHAFAADMAVKAPPPPASASFGWTGSESNVERPGADRNSSTRIRPTLLLGYR
jgi:hypothetical protein